ncbi:MAG: hypothetical protein HY287_14860 [Planctomycetes bacterium]|nr:hypothetical protein [Planctomycetota bacterium]MBI3835604.1 hypothetical protein [Planctomycetota bacterium]
MRVAIDKLLALIIGAVGSAAPLSAAIVDFDTSPGLPVGTRYGTSVGTVPGSTVFTTSDGISMSVDNFHLGTYTGFFRAQIDAPSSFVLPTNYLSLDNINVKFDFTNVAFPVSKVTLDYAEFGGGDNFSVNGGPLIQISPLTAVPTNVAPGVTATVIDSTITLNGPIGNFLIGGQELAIDHIVAVPEPGTLLLLTAPCIAYLLRNRLQRLAYSQF